jgi:hypothetical protein
MEASNGPFFVPGLKRPQNEAEFQALMEAVDSHLKSRDVPVHGRPLQGFATVSSSLKMSLRFGPERDKEPADGCYSGDDLVTRIFRWFDGRYGDKLKIHFGPGRAVVLIRNDPWVMFIPRFYGTVQIYTSKVPGQQNPISNKALPRYNSVDSLHGLPEGLRQSLVEAELMQISQLFGIATDSLMAIERASDHALVKEAGADLNAAVDHMVSNPSHFGQSKWASLQATEKVLKAFISSKGKIFKKIHNLSELANLAEAEGLPKFNRKVLDPIECSPGIRYGEEVTTLLRANAAHWACLSLCGHIAKATTGKVQKP